MNDLKRDIRCTVKCIRDEEDEYGKPGAMLRSRAWRRKRSSLNPYWILEFCITSQLHRANEQNAREKPTRVIICCELIRYDTIQIGVDWAVDELHGSFEPIPVGETHKIYQQGECL
jgi:hypothetical protein